MSNQIRVDPIDEDVPYDILEGQQIIYEPKPNWNIDMDKNIEKIWQTPKLNFEKLSFDNLDEFLSKEKQSLATPTSQKPKENETGSDEIKDSDADISNLNRVLQDNNEEFDQKKFFELKHSISQAIELAHIEMGVALDALTLILSNSDQQQTTEQPLPIPPKSITLTPANKPKAGHRALIHQSKLNLGSKKSQLTLASSLLRSGTTRLTKTIEVENTFWDQILQLSKLNWFIQKETTNEKEPAQYFIDCGFAGSGSKLSYETYAYINREVDGKLNLLLKYEVEQAITVRLQQTCSQLKLLKDKPIPMLPKGIYYPQSFISSDLPTDPVVLEAHEKLCKARSTILETELFNYLTKESLNIFQCSHNISGSVYLSINDDWELVFELKEVTKQEDQTPTHLHWLCSAIKTSLLFKLREHHKHLDSVQKGLLHTHDCLGVDEVKRIIPVVQDPQFIQYSKDMVLYYFFLQEIDLAIQNVLDSFKSVSTICESFSSQSFFKIEYYPIEDPKSHHSLLGHSLLIYIGRFNSINIELRAPNIIQLGIVEGSFAVETPDQLKKLLSKQINMILFGQI